MPGMNGTGPEGQGSRTGRDAGRCGAGTGRKNTVENGNIGQNNGPGTGSGAGMRGRGQKGGRGSGCGNRNRFGNK